MSEPFRILEHLRGSRSLSDDDLRRVVAGAYRSDDPETPSAEAWGDAQLGAFLMGVALTGLDPHQTGVLTRAMLDSGERWDLGSDVPLLGDKHSTGGVGDKVSLVLAPVLAACGLPVVMLTGRGLGHTGGTADKLGVIPGLEQTLERRQALRLLDSVGMALGVPTARIAPADRTLYRLRDVTATIRSIPLVVASILSKKLASGARALVLDVKTGNGAFMRDLWESRELARALVETAHELGLPTSAVLTDMSQPLGTWAGHTVEVRESLDALAGNGPESLMEVTYTLCEELAGLLGSDLGRADFERAISSGAARERFERWAVEQGADASWFDAPDLPVAPVEVVVEAQRDGVLSRVETEELGLLLVRAGGGRVQPTDEIDVEVALEHVTRLGEPVERGQVLARVYLREENPELARAVAECYVVEDTGEAPPLVYGGIERG